MSETGHSAYVDGSASRSSCLQWKPGRRDYFKTRIYVVYVARVVALWRYTQDIVHCRYTVELLLIRGVPLYMNVLCGRTMKTEQELFIVRYCTYSPSFAAARLACSKCAVKKSQDCLGIILQPIHRQVLIATNLSTYQK